MSPRSTFSWILIVGSMLWKAASPQDVCQDTGQPGCLGPYPPGHGGITPGWWAIGVWKGEGSDAFPHFLGITADLHAPKAPSELNGTVSFAPSLEHYNVTSGGDGIPSETIQTLLSASPQNNLCNQGPDGWCMFPSCYLLGTSVYDQKVSVREGDIVKLNYTYVPAAPDPDPVASLFSQFRQYPSVNAPWATDDPKALQNSCNACEYYRYSCVVPWQLWLKAECGCKSNGTVPAHRYTNLTMVLSQPVPEFGSSAKNNNSASSTPYTLDGGRTWHVDEINIEEGQCKAFYDCEKAANDGANEYSSFMSSFTHRFGLTSATHLANSTLPVSPANAFSSTSQTSQVSPSYPTNTQSSCGDMQDSMSGC